MRCSIFVVNLLLFHLFADPTMAAQMPDQQSATADLSPGVSAVIQMFKAEVPGDMIIKAVTASGKPLSLTSRDLAALRQAGVPEPVIAALSGPGPEPAPKEAPSVQNAGTPAAAASEVRENPPPRQPPPVKSGGGSAPSGSFRAQDWQGKKLVLQPLPNSSPWIHATIGGAQYSAKISGGRLFRTREAENIEVRRVKSDRADFVFELTSEHLGRGEIRFEEAAQWPATAWDEIFATLFTGPGLSNEARFIGSKTTRVLHFRGCNHPPSLEDAERFMSDSEAVKLGYRRCPLCFRWLPGFSGFDVERQIAAFQASSVRAWGPSLMEVDLQERVRRTGQRVIQAWPLPLKGYRYRFAVVDSDITNACALADGQVYITRSLLESLESDEELEAILAHEIAHVELRHTWRRYRSAQKASLWAAIATAAVAGTTRSRAATELASVLSNLAATIVLQGHSREHEEEADSFAAAYFEMNGRDKERRALFQALSKLQYDNELQGIDPKREGGLFASHPDLPDRIQKVRETRTGLLKQAVFEGLTADGELVATLNFEMQRYYPPRPGADAGFELIGLLDTTPALGDKNKIKDIVVESKGRRIKLDNKEDTEVEPGDSVGVVFLSKQQNSLLEDLTGVDLSLKNVGQWRRVQ